jgi:uncharacterized protein (DUF2235 family)
MGHRGFGDGAAPRSLLHPKPFLTLSYTRTNPSVAVFRHAITIDERRRMFRLNRWIEPQPFKSNPFAGDEPPPAQDIKQVWFSGVHADIGGGYPETESALSKFPLEWMIVVTVMLIGMMCVVAYRPESIRCRVPYRSR